MKRMIEGFDQARLVGRELESVLYASNLASLHLSDGVRITALSTIGHIGDGGVLGKAGTPAWQDTHLLALIGHRVEWATADENGCLVLGFDSDTLLFASDESGYESFIVALDDEEWFA
jgi:hypothetical protein